MLRVLEYISVELQLLQLLQNCLNKTVSSVKHDQTRYLVDHYFLYAILVFLKVSFSVQLTTW